MNTDSFVNLKVHRKQCWLVAKQHNQTSEKFRVDEVVRWHWPVWMRVGGGIYTALTQESSSRPGSRRWDSPAASSPGSLCSSPPEATKCLMMNVPNAETLFSNSRCPTCTPRLPRLTHHYLVVDLNHFIASQDLDIDIRWWLQKVQQHK